MAEEPKAAVAATETPAAPPKVQQVLPKVFARFDGGELPGFLKAWSADGPKPIDIAEIAEESELSKDQIKILKDAFDIFDTEHKGSICYDVVGDILELFTGEPIDEDQLDDLMDEFDEDESGEIEFSEFIELAEYFVEPEQDPKELKKDLREVFVLYDKQKKGYIPTSDFKGILKALDPEVPENELDGIVDEIDQDSSGTIDFHEFIEILLGDDDGKKK